MNDQSPPSNMREKMRQVSFIILRCLLWSVIYLLSCMIYLSGKPLSWSSLVGYLFLMGMYYGTGYQICRLFAGRGKFRKLMLTDFITIACATGVNIVAAPMSGRITATIENALREGMSSYISKRATHFSSDELNWIRWRGSGADTILFRSASGKTDSMMVTDIRYDDGYALSGQMIIQYEAGHPYSNTGTSDFYKADGMCGFRIIHEGSNLIGMVTMIKQNDNKIDFRGILKNEEADYLGDLAEGKYAAGETRGDMTEEDSLKTDFVIFTLDRHYDEQEGVKLDNRIVCFIISRLHGLEYYRFEDGEEFTRISDSR